MPPTHRQPRAPRDGRRAARQPLRQHVDPVHEALPGQRGPEVDATAVLPADRGAGDDVLVVPLRVWELRESHGEVAGGHGMPGGGDLRGSGREWEGVGGTEREWEKVGGWGGVGGSRRD